MRARPRQAILEIRRDFSNNGGIALPLDSRIIGVLLLTPVLLTLFYYYGRPGFFRMNLNAPLMDLLDLRTSPYRGLFPYWYWSVSNIILRILIPLACIVLWFRESPRDYGFRLWKKEHAWVYPALFVILVPVLVAVSFLSNYQNKYPLYKGAGESLTHFFLYELAYGIQFASVEAFFRGFLLFVLFKRFGYYSIFIMTIPYCMIHFGKPLSETLASVVAGSILGYLAIRSRSWVPGALLHWSVGITMDAACILQRTVG